MTISVYIVGDLRTAIFGGPDVPIGARIAPLKEEIEPGPGPGSDPGSGFSAIQEASSDDASLPADSASTILRLQRKEEEGHAIKYRSCSWLKTAALIFSECICLAIMNFPWSYSVLGLVPGLLLTLTIAVTFIYTSLVLWQLCLRHPEVRDVCDIGRILLGGSSVAWWFTAAMFLLNNAFIQGLHVLIGSEFLNTVVGHAPSVSCPTVLFAAVTAMVCWASSLPRTFNLLSHLATFSAVATYISVVLATAFSIAQAHPASPTSAFPAGDRSFHVWTPPGTTYVSGTTAFLNIAYTFVGQLALPSFIAEMREPRDFPKALWLVATLMTLTFGVVGAVMYTQIGGVSMTNPAFGSLRGGTYRIVAFAFMVPTIVFVGVLYASLSTRFVFFRVFKGTRHMHEHTWEGWSAWGGLLLVGWVVAFIISQVVPFFDSLLSIMASLFDSFFGFIFWSIAYYRMHRSDTKRGIGTGSASGSTPWISHVANVVLFCIGVFFLTGGMYATVQAVSAKFKEGVSAPFSCASNGLA